MPAAVQLVPNARRSAARAYHHYVRDGDGRFLLRDSALDVALRIRPHVFLYHHYVLHQDFAGTRENPQHAALLALVTSGDHFHRVIALDIHSCMHCLPSTIWRPQPCIRRNLLYLVLPSRLSLRVSVTEPQVPEKQSSKTSFRAARGPRGQTRACRW